MLIMFQKLLFVSSGSSASNGWARVKCERTKSRERLLRTILFYSCHLQHERERPDMKRKYMNSDKVQRKEPKSTILTHLNSKLFHILNREVTW